MGERTITVTCRDCGSRFEHTTGGGKTGGRVTKTLCRPCLKAAQQKATREHKRRKRAEAKAVRPTRTCRACHRDISDRAPRAVMCRECFDEARRECQRQFRAANPKRPVTFYCIVCNEAIARVGNSGRPLYCLDHAARAKTARRRRSSEGQARTRRNTWYTHCHYCEGELPEPRHSLRSPARCEPCKRQWHYEYMRNRATLRMAAARCCDCEKPVNPRRKGPRSRCADCQVARRRARYRQYSHLRRALINGVDSEDFLSIEIYERDGWRCGICRRKIRRELEHPHLLSASLDHVIPLVHGGPHSRANCQPAHLRCNLIKNDKIENVQMALFG